MTEDLTAADLDLLAELGALLRRCDPVPPQVVAAATAAFTQLSRESPVPAGESPVPGR